MYAASNCNVPKQAPATVVTVLNCNDDQRGVSQGEWQKKKGL